ncbi:hypothetical protein PhCBS80983_g00938 [Powellomyces hirtus]|uniref:RNA polymerase II-associated protein 3 n=1 Tax=Powellomyces hirtus TaxID=109895 RepID=A0A507EC76_9FUNG|nr:hypothetical protein PhCBS80983_g00938 [Powellomyces hirtus]
MSNTALKIRQNAEELKDYLRDLQSWETEIKQKDKAAREGKPAQNPPPVRTAEPAGEGGERKRSHAGMVGARADEAPASVSTGRPRAYDYRAWDKFDVDKALEDVDQPKSTSSSDAISLGTSVASQTDQEQSLVEKEKGNAWFKKADYKRAVSCYTRSIQLDRNNPILPVNRAMAYLKLSNWMQNMSKRSGDVVLPVENLENLQNPRKRALVLVPTNKAVRDDLSKLLDQTSQMSVESRAKHAREPEETARPLRRRLEIEEVGDEESRPIIMDFEPHKPSEAATSSLPSPSAKKPVISVLKSPKVDAAKAPRDKMPSSDVQESKPSETRVEIPKLSSAPNLATGSFAIPKTMYEFERDWKSIKNDTAMLYGYLKAINPDNYLKIFKNSLESDYLIKILLVMQQHAPEHNEADAAYLSMRALSRLPRFGMTLMFLSKREKQVIRDLISWLRSRLGNDVTYAQDDLSTLEKAYDVRI